LYPEVYVQYGTDIELLFSLFSFGNLQIFLLYSQNIIPVYSSFFKPVVIVLIFQNSGSSQMCEIQNFRKYQFSVIV